MATRPVMTQREITQALKDTVPPKPGERYPTPHDDIPAELRNLDGETRELVRCMRLLDVPAGNIIKLGDMLVEIGIAIEKNDYELSKLRPGQVGYDANVTELTNRKTALALQLESAQLDLQQAIDEGRAAAGTGENMHRIADPIMYKVDELDAQALHQLFELYKTVQKRNRLTHQLRDIYNTSSRMGSGLANPTIYLPGMVPWGAWQDWECFTFYCKRYADLRSIAGSPQFEDDINAKFRTKF